VLHGPRCSAFKPTSSTSEWTFWGANWIRTLESIPPYWESSQQMLSTKKSASQKGPPNADDTSPLLHAEPNYKPCNRAPGRQYPRVISLESDDIVNAIKKKGGVVEYSSSTTKAMVHQKENEIKGTRPFSISRQIS